MVHSPKLSDYFLNLFPIRQKNCPRVLSFLILAVFTNFFLSTSQECFRIGSQLELVNTSEIFQAWSKVEVTLTARCTNACRIGILNVGFKKAIKIFFTLEIISRVVKVKIMFLSLLPRCIKLSFQFSLQQRRFSFETISWFSFLISPLTDFPF